mmetsp:Transcript_124091/g.397105  ORF Transcript_124091/g.397105 Transcript_124091/m.397105 type:complete len:241 (+) Transcript_124091:666-1388(+)
MGRLGGVLRVPARLRLRLRRGGPGVGGRRPIVRHLHVRARGRSALEPLQERHLQQPLLRDLRRPLRDDEGRRGAALCAVVEMSRLLVSDQHICLETLCPRANPHEICRQRVRAPHRALRALRWHTLTACRGQRGLGWLHCPGGRDHEPRLKGGAGGQPRVAQGLAGVQHGPVACRSAFGQIGGYRRADGSERGRTRRCAGRSALGRAAAFPHGAHRPRHGHRAPGDPASGGAAALSEDTD